MKKYIEQNRKLWNELTGIHASSEFYDLESFKNGRCSLNSIELEEIGDVEGKTLLHLQCHFGMDTLSWARRGARVTGVDLSDDSIELARSLNDELGLDGTFIRSDIYDLPDVLSETFDIVYTSYGALAWLPDLGRWAETAARFTVEGGFFYVADFHPFSGIFNDDEDAGEFEMRYPYKSSAEPYRFDPEHSYASGDTPVKNPSHEWTHTTGDIVNAVASAGFRIEFLHEFPFSCYKQLPYMERCGDGYWRLGGGREIIPFMFSMKARN